KQDGGGRVGAAKPGARADELQILQHLNEIAGDGYLGNREGQLAVADPEARRSPRVIAGDDIDSEAHQFGDVEAVGNRLEDLFGRFVSLFKVEIAVADTGVAGDSARGVSSGLHAQLARRVCI